MDYKKIYDKIIDNAKLQIRKRRKRSHKEYIYYEKHHIIPKCIGGNDEKHNLVLLTAREHFLCHWLLCEIFPKEKKLIYALHRMCYSKSNSQNRYIPNISSRVYQYLRENVTGEMNGMFGKNHKIESIEKQKKTKSERQYDYSKVWENKIHHAKETIWISNGIESKMIKKSDTIPNGFILGRGGEIGKIVGEKLKGRVGQNSGKIRITNGKVTILIPKNSIIPNGYNRGSKKYKSCGNIGKIWINDGNVEKCINNNDSIPKGFIKGRLSSISKKISETKKKTI
jgi:hypothetical protein